LLNIPEFSGGGGGGGGGGTSGEPRPPPRHGKLPYGYRNISSHTGGIRGVTRDTDPLVKELDDVIAVYLRKTTDRHDLTKCYEVEYYLVYYCQFFNTFETIHILISF